MNRIVVARWHAFAFLLGALVCLPALASAQEPGGGSTSSMFSNLANPAIGMNALFSGLAAPNIDRPYGLQFDEAEISLISTVDPYWTFTSDLVFAPEGVDPEEVWVRSTNIPSLQLKLGKLRGTFGKQGQLHYGQELIMPNTLGNSAPMAESSPLFVCITGSEILRSPALLKGQSLYRDLDQEVQCS